MVLGDWTKKEGHSTGPVRDLRRDRQVNEQSRARALVGNEVSFLRDEIENSQEECPVPRPSIGRLSPLTGY